MSNLTPNQAFMKNCGALSAAILNAMPTKGNKKTYGQLDDIWKPVCKDDVLTVAECKKMLSKGISKFCSYLPNEEGFNSLAASVMEYSAGEENVFPDMNFFYAGLFSRKGEE